MNIDEKTEIAIQFLKKAEKLALKMQPEHGFWLSFSGGKDSCVILALAKMAGVKFTGYYNVTTIDPPELVRFIIEQHPEIVRIHPKESFFSLVKKKGFLPTRDRRYCCEILKERSAAGYCQILGIRKCESKRREKKWPSNTMQFKSTHQANAKDIDEMQATEFQCVGGKDTIKINPILDWTDSDVWSFIKKHNIAYCKLYDEGKTRLGCLFCPNAQKKQRERERLLYPKYYEGLKKAVEQSFSCKKNKYFDNAQDMLDWWFSDMSIGEWKAMNKQQLKLKI